MLDNNARLNQTVKPVIPDGYLLASVTYGAGPDAHRAVFLAHYPGTAPNCWVVGEWDAMIQERFYRSSVEPFQNIKLYPVSPEGFHAACMDFATRSNGLLKGYGGADAQK